MLLICTPLPPAAFPFYGPTTHPSSLTLSSLWDTLRSLPTLSYSSSSPLSSLLSPLLFSCYLVLSQNALRVAYIPYSSIYYTNPNPVLTLTNPNPISNYIAICSAWSALLAESIATPSVLIYSFKPRSYTMLSRSPCPFFLHSFITSINPSVISFPLLSALSLYFNLLSFEIPYTFVICWRLYAY